MIWDTLYNSGFHLAFSLKIFKHICIKPFNPLPLNTPLCPKLWILMYLKTNFIWWIHDFFINNQFSVRFMISSLKRSFSTSIISTVGWICKFQLRVGLTVTSSYRVRLQLQVHIESDYSYKFIESDYSYKFI